MIQFFAQADTHWTVIAAFWASIGALIIAMGAVYINYLFIRSQVDPHVIVYSNVSEAETNEILIVIENVGRGLAKEVTFSFSRPLPRERPVGWPDEINNGPLTKGIPSLGPGAKRVVRWGGFDYLFKKLGNSEIEANIHFRSSPIGPFAPESHEVNCILEVKSFDGTALFPNFRRQVVDELGNTARSLAQEGRIR